MVFKNNMAYQSFDVKGDSNSMAKWKATLLHKSDLLNMKVLDIGCNEGFFCLKCHEYGAKEITGIDRHQGFITRANQRKGEIKNINYKLSSWENLPNLFEHESFDVILLLSSMHYASSPDKILPNGTNMIMNDICKLLKKGGLFVYEGGIIMSDEEEWVKIDRIMDIVYHPTQKQFEKSASVLFENVEFIGPSVNQVGDRIPRYVYHCRK